MKKAALLIAPILAIAAMIAARRGPAAPKTEAPLAAPAPTEKTAWISPEPQAQGRALNDSKLVNLIRIARVASLKGDTTTRAAMVENLKKNPERSRELIAREIARTTDTRIAFTLQNLLAEIP